MARCIRCFAPVSGCLCSGADQRREEQEWRLSRGLLAARPGEQCEYNVDAYAVCGAPAVQAIMADGYRYGVCHDHLKYARAARLAHEDVRVPPPSQFGPCPVCKTDGTI